MEARPPHVLLVTLGTQGHINPSIQLARRLVHIGVDVTFVTTLHTRRRMDRAICGAVPKGLTFVAFSDGYDDGFKKHSDDLNRYLSQLRRCGMEALKDILLTSFERGRPVVCLVYAVLLHWAAEVAREAGIRSALLWVQPATAFDAYYYYLNGYGDEITKNCDDPGWKIQFPGIRPAFSKMDLPSFMLPSSPDRYSFLLPLFRDQMKVLDEAESKVILSNTFDTLECDALRSIEKYDLIGIGPLIPSSFLDGGLFDGDIYKQSSGDYMEWLSSNKPDSSVVYVSFGSLLKLPKPQIEEIAKGLLDCGRPFLWVVRSVENAGDGTGEEDEKVMEELRRFGKIVPWCGQVEVLTHPSVGCFVTHCGWNSTLESLSCGVPTVAFPVQGDQGTNAKLVEDVWGTGVRVREDENGIVKSDEIRRCIEKVMNGGERSRDLRENAEKWKGLAREAMDENGSSNNNLKAFFLRN